MITHAKTSWQDARKVRLMVLSPTQVEAWQRCKRYWWLKNVRKLPEIERASGTFGTVMHSVIERFLRADNLGRDTNGNPVEIYPEGWQIARNRYDATKIDGTITPTDEATIKTLIAVAIESGVLERVGADNDRAIEQEFTEELLQLKCPTCKGESFVPCPTCDGGLPEEIESCPDGCIDGRSTCPTCNGDGKGDHIQVKQYIDYMLPDGIQDHKSTKSMKYAKSKEALRINAQMLINAHALLELRRKEALPELEKVSLRHNVYCKDPNDQRVRKTEVFVTPEEVDTFWSVLKEMAIEMSALRRSANGWKHCPDPVSHTTACNAYGGCSFMSICGGQESEEMYENRLAKQKEAAILLIANSTTILTKEATMGILDQLKARAAALASTTNPAPTPTTPVTQPPTSPTPQTVGVTSVVVDAIPWADTTCTACQGLGFNTNGNPCKICDLRAMKGNGRPRVESFALENLGDGTTYWKHPTLGEGISPMKHGAGTPVKVENKVEVVIPKQEPTMTLMPSVVIAPTTAPAPQTHAPSIDKKTRAKKGFTLCIDCAVMEGLNDDGITHMATVFADLTKQMSVAAGVDYRDMDPWKRRDQMAKEAEAIADTFATTDVVVDLANATPDLKALTEAIRPFARKVHVGTL